ncbi:MAG: substrate-binding domain-containing protein [Sulfuricella sp.]
MFLKERQYLVALSFVLAAIGCLATRPVLAVETLTIGGNGGAIGSMKLLGSAFEKAHPGIKVVVLPSLGTSGGIKAVYKGAIDIGLSGRLLTDEEKKLGLVVAEYAKTPLVFAVKADNPLSGLSKDEFLSLLKGAPGTALHGQRMRPILRPAKDAETLLIIKNFPEIGKAIERTLSSPLDATVALNAQDAADLIEKIPGAIGFSALSLVRSEKRRMKVLPFDGVAPSAENITNGSYPLVMGLYLVTKPNPPERIRKFIEFVHSDHGARLLEESGNYVVGQRK